MTLRAEPFEVSDLLLLEPEDRGLEIMGKVWGLGTSLGELQNEWAWTGWNAYGKPVVVLGIMESGFAWGIMSRDMRRHMVQVLRGTKAMLEAHVAERGPVSAYIDPAYAAAVRWARMLKFKPGPSNIWRFDGSTT